jgi:hypothetical protein
MECRYVKERVWLYVEGDLKQKAQQAVTRHVASCRNCAGLVAEARESQAWLRSSEPAPFDEAFMASVRKGARERIGTCQASRFQYAAMWVRVNLRPLVLACPSLLLVCWLAVHWVTEGRRNYGGAGLGTTADVVARKEGEKITVAAPLVGGSVKQSVIGQHRRRVKQRVKQVPQDKIEDVPTQATIDASALPLRIEIQTEDPNVRIIWFAFPGDGSVSTGPDK